MSEELNKELFRWVIKSVLSDGGDGDAKITFKCQDLEEVSKQFEEVLKEFKININKEISINEYVYFLSYIDEWIVLEKYNKDKYDFGCERNLLIF